MFGAHDDSGEPLVVDGIDLTLGSAPDLTPGKLYPPVMGPAPGHTDSLADQGWGIIYPHTKRGKEARQLLEPLIRRRVQSSGQPLREYLFPVDAADNVRDFCKNSRLTDSVDGKPYYLLIVGDLDEIPLEMQTYLARWKAVGRLAFSRLEDYAVYAQKVCALEDLAPCKGKKILLYSIQDGTRATRWAADQLIDPCSKLLEEKGSGGAVRVRYEEQDELRRAAAEAQSGVLFTASHGCCRPRNAEWRSLEEMRSRQGAMQLYETAFLRAEDVHSGPFLRGGFWFMLACFGAGTPVVSRYKPWIDALSPMVISAEQRASLLRCLPRPNEGPFIAALPKAALANPDGPLAFIGHIDLAWSYAFDGALSEAEPERLTGILRDVARSHLVGSALKHLNDELSRVDHDLSEQMDRLDGLVGPLHPRHRPLTLDIARNKLKRCDLGNYILLGDPAVRLARGA